MSSTSMKLLLVTGRYPWPVLRGDQLRTVQQLELLARHHAVTLLCPAPPPGAPAPETPGPFRLETYSVRRSLVSGTARSLTASLPLQTAFFHQPDLTRKVRELGPTHDLTVLQMIRLAGAVEALGGRPFVVDLVDCLSLNFETRARVDRFWLRPLWMWEAARIRRNEGRILSRSRGGWVVCRRDRRALHAHHPRLDGKVEVVRIVIPVGERRLPDVAAQPDSPDLVLTGNMGYFVNDDAARWFLRRVWPRLKRERPETTLCIAGARPGELLTTMAARADASIVEAPKDLRAIVRSGAIALAPMRCGSGAPLKVLEAWAERRAVLATQFAASGTDGLEGKHLEVVGDGDGWVRSILELLDDPGRRRRLGVQGAALVGDRHSPEAVEAELVEVLSRSLLD